METTPPIKFRAKYKVWMARRTRVGRLCLRLIAMIVIASTLRAAGIVTLLDEIVNVLCLIVLLPLLVVLFYRWVTQRVLWKVRNRLILTYLLMGLSPVVLFGTLGGIAAYLLAGQYATNSVLTVLDQASMKVKDEAGSEAAFALQEPQPKAQPGHPAAMQHSAAFAGSRVSVSMLNGDSWHPLIAPSQNANSLPLPNPAWLKAPFRGIVASGSELYICSVANVQLAGKSVEVLGSMPLDEREIGELAAGLGTVTLMPGFTNLNRHAKDDAADPDPDVAPSKPDQHKNKFTLKADGETKAEIVPDPSQKFTRMTGGVLPPRAHFFDTPVVFSAPIENIVWSTGDTQHSLIVVTSRPTLLYAHLFATSVAVGFIVRAILIAVTVLFSLVELVTLLMALGLSRTITRAVADLYRGTREVDAGNLAHRVRVAKHDQLGALASSFNGMAASVSSLLIQQREQQRLLNELAIAQEVQTTLFPHSPALLGGLEMHALCMPARTVGGDYFDFIFGSHSGLCLALGDISGKGISAALLMASLHSAVRAFSLGQSESEGRQPSPAMLLKLLNRHLYLSTQSARYATLFLAFYDQKTRKLTYSNGGHLPPMLLSTDGTVRRLECGGSVVGLLEELDYEQATVQLETGDLLIAFTDGLTEPESGANALEEEFGEDRLLTLMQQHREEPLPTLAGNTLMALKQWIGNKEQPDDMTILLARQL